MERLENRQTPDERKKPLATNRMMPKKTGGQGVAMGNLTPKQERFAQFVAGGECLSGAYRAAFQSERMTAKTICESASRLMADRKVTARVDHLRGEHMRKVAESIKYDYQAAMRELDDAIAFAKVSGSAGAFVAALNLKQKISGLHVEARQNGLSPIAGMSHDRVRAAIDALVAMRAERLQSG